VRLLLVDVVATADVENVDVPTENKAPKSLEWPRAESPLAVIIFDGEEEEEEKGAHLVMVAAAADADALEVVDEHSLLVLVAQVIE
jgi:hypothetical protein